MQSTPAKAEKKYEVLKNYITGMIDEGLYEDDDRLPSENELMKQFGTSHITVRRAMSDLVNDGLIYRVQGKGSFVSPKVREVLGGLTVSHSVFTGEQQDSSFISMLQGTNEYFSSKDIAVRVDFVAAGEKSENEYLFRLIREKIGGALLFLSRPEDNIESLSKMTAAGIPYVLLDRCARGHQTNYVGSNNIAGAYEQVRHLTRLGHRRIAFVSFAMALNTERERYVGYQEGMQDFCCGEPLTFVSNRDQLIHEVIPKICLREITALCVVNDRTAIEVMKILETNGLSIPGDVSVIGFDNYQSAMYVIPALTTIRQDFVQIGRQGARLLYEQLRKPGAPPRTVLVNTALAARDSTGAPPVDPRKPNQFAIQEDHS